VPKAFGLALLLLAEGSFTGNTFVVIEQDRGLYLKNLVSDLFIIWSVFKLLLIIGIAMISFVMVGF
jgi:hypothetical protein